jgi:hypothetical protein
MYRIDTSERYDAGAYSASRTEDLRGRLGDRVPNERTNVGNEYWRCARAGIGENASVNKDLELRHAAARERVHELSGMLGRGTMQAWPEAQERLLQAERDRAAARGEQ